jgi:acetyl-CoA carboxylase beta subunit
MATAICPKCNKVIYVPDSPVQLEKDFVICCDEVIYIPTDQDRDIFFTELSNPSEPNEALKNAASQYKKLTDEAHDSQNEA